MKGALHYLPRKSQFLLFCDTAGPLFMHQGRSGHLMPASAAMPSKVSELFCTKNTWKVFYYCILLLLEWYNIIVCLPYGDTLVNKGCMA